MSSFFDDLESQLAGAARAQTAVRDARGRGRGGARQRRARGGGWIAATGRAVPIALAVMIALAISVLGVVLVHHGRVGGAPQVPTGPGPGPGPTSNGPIPLFPSKPTRVQERELAYVQQALNSVYRRDVACLPGASRSSGDTPGRKPSLSQGSPAAATLTAFSVLRRAAVASDKLPPRLIGAPPDQQVYPDGTIPPVKDVYIRYVRQARHRFGANYYVVPAGDINLLIPAPARCFAKWRAALRTEETKAPADLSAGVAALGQTYLAALRHNALPYPGICLIAINDTGNGGGDCDAGGSLSQIENGNGEMPSGAPTGVGVVYGLVPDGVRTVTFEYQRHRPVTALAINNVFIVRRRGLPNYGFPNTIVWRAADGKIIKVIHRP